MGSFFSDYVEYIFLGPLSWLTWLGIAIGCIIFIAWLTANHGKDAARGIGSLFGKITAKIRHATTKPADDKKHGDGHDTGHDGGHDHHPPDPSSETKKALMWVIGIAFIVLIVIYVHTHFGSSEVTIANGQECIVSMEGRYSQAFKGDVSIPCTVFIDTGGRNWWQTRKVPGVELIVPVRTKTVVYRADPGTTVTLRYHFE